VVVCTKYRCCSKRRSGSVMVEFALAFTLLWTCLAGIFQFGYGLYCYNALTIAVENASAYATTVDFDATAQTFITKIKNAVVYGDPNGGAAALAPGLTTGQVAVTWSTDAAGAPQTITITIQGYTCNAIFSTWTWTGKPFATVRYMGVWKK
jgi:Flp pilus assembly protein TadG